MSRSDSALSRISHALVQGGPTALATVREVLKNTRRLSADELLEQQRRHLSLWLPLVARMVPFHRHRMDAALRAGPNLTWEAFRQLPRLCRADLQEQGAELQNQRPPPAFRPLGTSWTSGSTGRPLATQGTQGTGLLLQALRLRMIEDNQLDPQQAAAFITTPTPPGVADPPEGGTRGPWAAPLGTGPGFFLNLRADPTQQLTWLEHKAPAYLTTYPSNLLALLKLSAERGVTLPSLRAVTLSSEPISDELRELCNEQWGARCIATYSANECGPLALQTVDGPDYWVQGEHVVLEVLDDAGEPCGPGQIGKVVITTLHDALRPLIRYEVGDYAEVGEVPASGQGLPRLRRIMGRERTMVRLSDGRRVWPFFELSPLVGMPALRQWQVLQKLDGSLEVRLVTQRPLDDAEENQVLAVIGEALPGLPICLRRVGEIQRTASGKYVELVSELGE